LVHLRSAHCTRTYRSRCSRFSLSLTTRQFPDLAAQSGLVAAPESRHWEAYSHLF